MRKKMLLGEDKKSTEKIQLLVCFTSKCIRSSFDS